MEPVSYTHLDVYKRQAGDIGRPAALQQNSKIAEIYTKAFSYTHLKVTDAVKDFPSVKVEVINGELTLTGNVSPEQARKIKMSVDALKAGKVNYNYTVK